MEELLEELDQMCNDLFDNGLVSEGDRLSLFADKLSNYVFGTYDRIDTQKEPRPVDETHALMEKLATTLTNIIDRYVPEKDYDDWVEALMEFEEYSNG